MKKLVPSALKKAYRKVFPSWKGNTYHCPVCSTNLAYYNPLPEEYYVNWKRYGFEPGDRQETLFVKHYKCPKCSCADRDRFAALVVKDWLKGRRDLRMLEFAPLPSTMNFFQSQPEIRRFETADIASELAQHKVDICDLSKFPDGSFDLVYCSHVLEHVNEDEKAMKELCRILAPGGMVLLFVPIFDLPEIVEDKGNLTEAERWKRFGQNDHVRMYNSKGFMDRMTSAGFTVEKRPASYFEKSVLDKAGVSASSCIYLGFKSA